MNEKSNECRYPDVLVTKKHHCDLERDVIYVVWQEKVNNVWQINSNSFFINSNNTPVGMDEETYLSTPTGGYWNSIYPRIEGNYLPYKMKGGFHMDSATTIAVVWQQDFQTPGKRMVL